MDQPFTFSHERLVAFHVAAALVAQAAEMRAGFPRGEGALADQLTRAADSALLNLCEGAARRAGREKARFFDIARGSVVECAAILTAVTIRRLAPPATTHETRRIVCRLSGLLSGLARSARARGSA